jgi:hypothetical protein
VRVPAHELVDDVEIWSGRTVSSDEKGLDRLALERHRDEGDPVSLSSRRRSYLCLGETGFRVAPRVKFAEPRDSESSSRPGGLNRLIATRRLIRVFAGITTPIAPLPVCLKISNRPRRLFERCRTRSLIVFFWLVPSAKFKSERIECQRRKTGGPVSSRFRRLPAARPLRAGGRSVRRQRMIWSRLRSGTPARPRAVGTRMA